MTEDEVSLKGTMPSLSYPTLISKTVATLNSGIAVTNSAEEKYDHQYFLYNTDIISLKKNE